MEDDLDGELLAIVGGNKEEKKKKRSQSKKSSKSKKRNKESSDEEGELSDDIEDYIVEEYDDTKRQKPLKKRRVEEDQLSDDERFDDGYDSELMGDEKDRDYLFSLPEVERENIIAERYNKRQEGLERFKLKQKLKREKGGHKDKRSATLRSKYEKGNKASALDDLKKRRAKASQAVQSSSSDEEEIKDESVDSDDEFVIKEDKERIRKERERPSDYRNEEVKSDDHENNLSKPVNLQQLNAICLKRDWVIKKMDEPYFSEVAKGCFVRVGIGQHEGKPVYRVAEIIAVNEQTKTYSVGKQKAHKNFNLQHGTFEKPFTFEVLSNQRITESEFQKWYLEMQKNHLPIITVEEALAKYEAILKTREHTYTEAEARKMVEAKMRLRGIPMNIAAEKVKLMNLRDEAKDRKDEEEVQVLEHQIKELDKQAASGRTLVDRSALINARNQQLNRNRSEQSDVRTQISFSSNPQLDPFSRRPTKPSNVISELLSQKLKVQSLEQEDGSSTDGTKEESKIEKREEKEDKKEVEEEKKNTIPDIDPQTLLKNAHNFDINLDEAPKDIFIPDAQPEKPQPVKQEPVSKPKLKKPSLSVNDYKKRMGLL